jgi:hypothetical protein
VKAEELGWLLQLLAWAEERGKETRPAGQKAAGVFFSFSFVLFFFSKSFQNHFKNHFELFLNFNKTTQQNKNA